MADDQNTDLFTVGKKVRIDLADMDYKSWLHELEQDAENLELLTELVGDITPEHDTKLQTLLALIREKQAHPINPGNRKIIIFTAFSDTADYLYQNVSRLFCGNSDCIPPKSPATWKAEPTCRSCVGT